LRLRRRKTDQPDVAGIRREPRGGGPVFPPESKQAPADTGDHQTANDFSSFSPSLRGDGRTEPDPLLPLREGEMSRFARRSDRDATAG
jgi:hypothetical protein